MNLQLDPSSPWLWVLMVAAALPGFWAVRYVIGRQAQGRAELAAQATARGWVFRDESAGSGEVLVFEGAGWAIRTARSTASAGAGATSQPTSQVTIRFTAPALAAARLEWGLGQGVGPELPGGADLGGLMNNPMMRGMLALLPGAQEALEKALEFQQNSEPFPLGSAAFQKALPARVRPGGAAPFTIDPALEALFLHWPAPGIDAARELSAYRDAEGLQVKLACHMSRLRWPIFDHLGELGEALMRAMPR